MTETKSMKLHTGRAVLASLEAEGVKHVYTLPGSHILPIYDAIIYESDIQLILCKIEASISFMADVHGRLTGEPGVCLVTAGPAALNSASGVAQAMASGSPVIHITGAVPPEAGLEAFHGVDDTYFTHKMFEHITKASLHVNRIEDIPEAMAQAFHIARSGRPGPVHIELPRETNASPHMIAAEPAEVAPYVRRTPQFSKPEEREIAAILEALAKAEHPVIVAGKGVLRRDAVSLLGDFAKQIAAPVVQVQDALGAISDDHPCRSGFLSMWSVSPSAKTAFEEADMVLAIGMRHDTSTARELAARVKAPLYLASFDGPERADLPKPLAFPADPPAILAALNERAPEASPERRERVFAEVAEARASEVALMRELLDEHRGDFPMHPGVLIDELCEEMPENTILSSDVGNCAVWLRSIVPLRDPFSHLQSGTWNSMGFALPACIAAKVAQPDRPAVGVIGDGALLMTSGEFSTAVDLDLPIVLIVMNDARFGMIERMQTMSFGRTGGFAYKEPNFAEMARSMGGAGFRVERREDLRKTLKEALACGAPAIVDVKTENVPYPAFEFK